MSSVKELTIVLDYPEVPGNVGPAKDRQFSLPGDNLHGVVILELNSSLRVRLLHLQLTGLAYTAWEIPGKRKTYEDSETYLDKTELLIPEDRDGRMLPKGYHRFAFRIPLPHNLPSTFHGPYGSVAYSVRAVLEAEDETENTFCSIPFLVLRRDPLPQQAYDKVKMNKSKTFIGLDMGKVAVECSLDHAIAVPGEALLVNAVSHNWSDKDITKLEGALVVEAVYRAKGKKLVFRQYLNKRQDFFDVNLRWGRKWTDVRILVPPFLADHGLAFCNIIDIKYLMQYRVQIKGQDDLVVEAPLYVGYHQDVIPQNDPNDPKYMLMNRMLGGNSVRRYSSA